MNTTTQAPATIHRTAETIRLTDLCVRAFEDSAALTIVVPLRTAEAMERRGWVTLGAFDAGGRRVCLTALGRAVAIEDIQRWVAERRAKGLNVDYWTALLCMRSLDA